jgi:transcriptional regulator with XRE-family HTH domain
MKLGETLLKLCKKRGLSLAQLSRMSGVPTPTLHGWSIGKAAANLDQLKKVAVALEVSLHELAFGGPDPYESPGEEILQELFRGDIRVILQKVERKKS